MPSTGKKEETPLMKQYNQIKAKHPEAILLFRVGDFYETFGADAIRTSKALGIVLTRRANGAASHIELAGFPHHSIDTYLPKLIKAGYRVAICDQLEDPKTTKTIVKRGITEMVSPGVVLMNGILEENSSNFLAAIYFEEDRLGAAFLDISTGEFKVSEDEVESIQKLISSMDPAEILYPKSQRAAFDLLKLNFRRCSSMEDWNFTIDHAHELLMRQFQVTTLKSFGLENIPSALKSAGACLQYLQDSQHHALPHVVSLEKIEQSNYLFMDRFTQRNLELVSKNQEDSKTLFEVLNHTTTPMGGRLLRNWLRLPLKDLQPISERHDLVDYFYQNIAWTHKLIESIKPVGDLERLLSRIALQKANPREIWSLSRSIQAIHEIYQLVVNAQDAEEVSACEALKNLGKKLYLLPELEAMITKTLHPEAPINLQKGNVIAEGFDAELDQLRSIAFGGKDYLINLQKREAERTGIPSLKISFNSVFGYYFEVTHIHREKIPEDWIRKQTLVNAERYISAELKEYEEKILGAEDKINSIERSLYLQFIAQILSYLEPLQKNAQTVAYLDVLTNFAAIALQNRYSRPLFNSGNALKIWGGRHPVIEDTLALGTKYIPNDLLLEPPDQQILMITGPNMSGKSAILRQTALIVIMAQMGCYVPAERVEMGLIDKVFTRVGASDNLTAGQSTFMMEMLETASILNNLSERSLLLLDEIGRGTSTYDGISIAWAIAEFLNQHPKFKPKTLFATHYHELNEMEPQFKGIKNFSVAVKESNDKVIFLRKLIAGGSEHSFGIQVAKMAGVPLKVVIRAKELLLKMETGNSIWGKMGNKSEPALSRVADPLQKYGRKGASEIENLKVGEDPENLNEIYSELMKLDLDRITPMEALMLLSSFKKRANSFVNLLQRDI